MSGFAYCGRDLGGLVCAKVVGRSVNAVAVEAMRVAGRAGAKVVGSWVPPEDVTLRLWLDPGRTTGMDGMSNLRHQLREALTRPEGGDLVLPDDPGLTYRDALLTAADGWDSLFEDGSCLVTFTVFDPVAYGERRTSDADAIDVGGTAATLPILSLVASAGSAVQAGVAGGRAVRVERGFSGGEAVVIDCEGERVTVDGADAMADVALGSDFFSLGPGACKLAFEGCSSHTVSWFERWA